MSTEIAAQLAKFVVETKYPQIQEDVIEFAKSLALKIVAGMVAGSAFPSSRKITKIVKDRKLPGEVGVIGCGFKTSLWEAVLLNAFFAHASELEDDSFGQGLSWDITVIPLLFPLAQYLRLSGKALTEALVVGLEVHSRTCIFPTEHLGLQLFNGAMGPAAAAARAIGLSAKETISALGLSMSAPALATTSFGTEAHYFESSLESLQGMMAADMAKAGMSGNPDIIEYLSGLLGKERIVPDKIVENLGKEWAFRNIWIKKYPCCFFLHRAIDILLELRKQNDLAYEKVEKIEVHINPFEEICNRPEVNTLGDLQFSFQHILGCALLDGDVNFSHVDPDILFNARYREARSKVRVIGHPDWPTQHMGSPAILTVRTKDGKEFSGERMHSIGSTKEPLTTKQFRELYSKFTKGVLTEEQIEKTAEAVLNLEKLNDVEELMDILTFRPKI